MHAKARGLLSGAQTQAVRVGDGCGCGHADDLALAHDNVEYGRLVLLDLLVKVLHRPRVDGFLVELDLLEGHVGKDKQRRKGKCVSYNDIAHGQAKLVGQRRAAADLRNNKAVVLEVRLDVRAQAVPVEVGNKALLLCALCRRTGDQLKWRGCCRGRAALAGRQGRRRPLLLLLLLLLWGRGRGSGLGDGRPGRGLPRFFSCYVRVDMGQRRLVLGWRHHVRHLPSSSCW